VSCPIYLDCNATTPLEDCCTREVFLMRYVDSRSSATREQDARVRALVPSRRFSTARDQLAAVVARKRDEVTFTSGATESNNLAILGLRDARAQEWAATLSLRRLSSTRLCLSPSTHLEREGLRRHAPAGGARAALTQTRVFAEALRPDTLLVSLMQVEQRNRDSCNRLTAVRRGS
jgi:cysteine desulfurase